MPERIQRQRMKGWRMPAGTVYVGRPTRWSNPYTVERWGLEKSIRFYRDALEDCFSPVRWNDLSVEDYFTAYNLRSQFRKRFGHKVTEAMRYELRGKNLACWCPLSQACHADVLLEVAMPERTDAEIVESYRTWSLAEYGTMFRGISPDTIRKFRQWLRGPHDAQPVLFASDLEQAMLVEYKRQEAENA